jgi:hypothetical protein
VRLSSLLFLCDDNVADDGERVQLMNWRGTPYALPLEREARVEITGTATLIPTVTNHNNGECVRACVLRDSRVGGGIDSRQT